MSQIKLDLISLEIAKRLNEILQGKGCPAENRVLICTPTGEQRSKGGLIIPGQSDDLPRKGVVIQMGPFDEDHKIYEKLIQVGTVITFGIYAGKEVELDFIPPTVLNLEEHQLTVLSATEMIYLETNQ